MKNIILFIPLLLLFMGCNFKSPTDFTANALGDELTSLTGKSLRFQDILEKYQGKKMVIDLWASWCRDCIEGLPDVIRLQDANAETVFVFLSVDRSIDAWKSGIERYEIKGDHYYMNHGLDGELGDFLNLNWIPRYVVVDRQGKIALFKAAKASDEAIQNKLDLIK